MNVNQDKPRLRIVLPLIASMAVFFTALYFLRNAKPDSPAGPDPQPPARATAPLSHPLPVKTGIDPVLEKWGIHINGVYLAVGGNLLDLRYTVYDSEKAAHLVKQKQNAYLVNEANGQKLNLPRVARLGSMRQTNQKLQPGYRYSLQFPNPERKLHSGSQVTLAIGNFRAEHLTVQ